jgi:hypothetical protein
MDYEVTDSMEEVDAFLNAEGTAPTETAPAVKKRKKVVAVSKQPVSTPHVTGGADAPRHATPAKVKNVNKQHASQPLASHLSSNGAAHSSKQTRKEPQGDDVVILSPDTPPQHTATAVVDNGQPPPKKKRKPVRAHDFILPGESNSIGAALSAASSAASDARAIAERVENLRESKRAGKRRVETPNEYMEAAKAGVAQESADYTPEWLPSKVTDGATRPARAAKTAAIKRGMVAPEYVDMAEVAAMGYESADEAMENGVHGGEDGDEEEEDIGRSISVESDDEDGRSSRTVYTDKVTNEKVEPALFKFVGFVVSALHCRASKETKHEFWKNAEEIGRVKNMDRYMLSPAEKSFREQIEGYRDTKLRINSFVVKLWATAASKRPGPEGVLLRDFSIALNQSIRMDVEDCPNRNATEICVLSNKKTCVEDMSSLVFEKETKGTENQEPDKPITQWRFLVRKSAVKFVQMLFAYIHYAEEVFACYCKWVADGDGVPELTPERPRGKKHFIPAFSEEDRIVHFVDYTDVVALMYKELQRIEARLKIDFKL